MGLGDFLRGAVDAGTDLAASTGADKLVDYATEPIERVGNVLTGAGKAVNWASDQAGKVGDAVQNASDAMGLPSQVGSTANFLTGGGTQWVGRSVGDLTQTAGLVGENIDTMAKGVATGANFVDEHPEMARLAAGAGLTWAANHKMDIGKGIGKAVLDEATDPASLALMAFTGGTSTALKGGLSAGVKAAAEGGIKAGVKAGVAEGGAALLRGGTKAAVEEGAVELTEAVGKTGVRQAATNLVKDTFTGRNLPASETPGIMGRVDRAIEMTKLRPNPTGRLAQARAGLAESISGEGNSIVKDAIANRVRAGSGKPMYGGDAAVNAWRVKQGVKAADRLGDAGEAATIAADPKAYAMKKMFSGGDTASTGMVTEGRSSTSITGDLAQPAGRSGYTNSYTPGRGAGGPPSILPSRGAGELTTGESTAFEVRDPYAQGSAYGQPETGFTVKDPYKPLTQPKKQPEGVYSV